MLITLCTLQQLIAIDLYGTFPVTNWLKLLQAVVLFYGEELMSVVMTWPMLSECKALEAEWYKYRQPKGHALYAYQLWMLRAGFTAMSNPQPASHPPYIPM